MTWEWASQSCFTPYRPIHEVLCSDINYDYLENCSEWPYRKKKKQTEKQNKKKEIKNIQNKLVILRIFLFFFWKACQMKSVIERCAYHSCELWRQILPGQMTEVRKGEINKHQKSSYKDLVSPTPIAFSFDLLCSTTW